MSHRNVLEKNFDSMTIKHVALMESEAKTMVVITDNQFKIMKSSDRVSEGKQILIQKGKAIDFSHHGVVIESRWKTAPYLATASPIKIDGQINGYVYMFLNTETIRSMIQNLTVQFITVGGITVVLSIISIIFLSRFITIPLIQMKSVTERLSNGKSELTLDVNRDDELGDLARSIQKLADDLERLKKERSEFLSSISHELRTPLTYLKGYADILKRPTLTEQERLEYVTIIEEEASNLAKLVKDLFDLAKMDQNQFNINKETVELAGYLLEISRKFKTAYEEKNIQLQYSCEKDIYIAIDPVRFGQVINNLLDNALKYSKPNTKVLLTLETKSDQVILKISDQGEGIPPNELPYIWDRLYRIDKSRSRATGGSGLGLTIAKEIIEAHKGKIEVKSRVAKGTEFNIYLPK
ncbi:sensor histidine kinase [Cytobacillus sp. FJAT-54145]|uniref:histidine kinase n=1 Tax=Cytobacillus spartinae TaxID=3299023 RepID=A0ABW6KFS1_9BACI